MENLKNRISMKIIKFTDYLSISILVDNTCKYQTDFKMNQVDLDILKGTLEQKNYDILIFDEKKIEVKTKGGIIISADTVLGIEKVINQIEGLTNLVQSKICYCNKEWKIVGKLKEIKELVKTYSTLKYSFGMAYNSLTIEEIVISTWNRGLRVYFPNLFPHGDDGKNFHAGTVVYTNDTDDNESKGIFYHRYVNSNFQPCCGSNGNGGENNIYVRLL